MANTVHPNPHEGDKILAPLHLTSVLETTENESAIYASCSDFAIVCILCMYFVARKVCNFSFIKGGSFCDAEFPSHAFSDPTTAS